MTEFLINAENVVSAADYLIDGFSGKYQIIKNEEINIESILEPLKQALHNFKTPVDEITSAESSPIRLFDKHLAELLKSTNEVFEILTDESKKLLVDDVNANKNAVG